MQIEYGLLTDPAGRPVAIDVYRGNTQDSIACKEVLGKIRGKLGLKTLVLVGDRRMITKTRIKDLRGMAGPRLGHLLARARRRGPDADHGAWSSCRGNPYAYPPYGRRPGRQRGRRAVQNGVICAAAPKACHG